MMQAPPNRSSTPGQPDRSVQRLGIELGAHVEEVLARTVAYTREAARKSGTRLDPVVNEHFERIGRSSTVAVAHWMADGNSESGRDAGREAWHTYGLLAAQSAA